jgi:hypothetical protein
MRPNLYKFSRHAPLKVKLPTRRKVLIKPAPFCITIQASFMEEILKKMRAIENVVNTNTMTVLKTIKEEPSVKLD